MDMGISALGTVWRLLSWLPGFVLRRFFTKNWLASHVAVDVRPRHDPVTILGGELPEVQIWLVVANHGYFAIELDRMVVELIYSGVIARFVNLQRAELKSGQSMDLFLRGPLTGEQTTHIWKNRDRPMVALQARAEFNCKVHDFATDTGQMAGVRPELVNF